MYGVCTPPHPLPGAREDTARAALRQIYVCTRTRNISSWYSKPRFFHNLIYNTRTPWIGGYPRVKFGDCCQEYSPSPPSGQAPLTTCGRYRVLFIPQVKHGPRALIEGLEDGWFRHIAGGRFNQKTPLC